MAYHLRKTKKNNDIYLQIYSSYWDKEKNQPRNKYVESIGFVSWLKEKGINDPVAYAEEKVNKLNKESKEEKIKEKTVKISEYDNKNFGYYIAQNVINKLDYSWMIDKLELSKESNFKISDLLNDLVYSRILNPSSKLKTYEEILPTLLFKEYDSNLKNLYEGIRILGQNYEDIIDILNERITAKFKRKTTKTYFDCTNFYFQINKEDQLRKKGPSKEKRLNPIVSMGLLLDQDLIPLTMKIFPGNESEKPYLRKCINKMKKRQRITGKTIQIADKGLNSAKNIIESTKNFDGYIFGQSIKKMKSEDKKELLENKNFKFFFDEKTGELIYKIATYDVETTYSYINDEGKKETQKINERRVLSWSNSLYKKQLAEIDKLANKAANIQRYQYKKDQFGGCSKYLKLKDKSSFEYVLDQEKINEDKSLCGYNLLITSEQNMTGEEIYNAYKNLWRIEESFKILKSQLNTRPIYLQNENSIIGHFLICYFPTTILRLLEFIIYKNKYSINELIRIIKNMNCIQIDNKKYFNITQRNKEIYKFPTNDDNELMSRFLYKKYITKLFN